MYMHNRKQSEAALRFAERRKREDDAPRLSAEVPRLLTLRLEIEERSGGSVVAEPVHVRRIVVEHAPALFFLPCGETRFDGQDVCAGSQGSGQCSRVLHYVAVATYA